MSVTRLNPAPPQLRDAGLKRVKTNLQAGQLDLPLGRFMFSFGPALEARFAVPVIPDAPKKPAA